MKLKFDYNFVRQISHPRKNGPTCKTQLDDGGCSSQCIFIPSIASSIFWFEEFYFLLEERDELHSFSPILD